MTLDHIQKFFHHRAYRSRQIDAGRPLARIHRRGQRARENRSDSRQHGPRARARYYHQGQSGLPELPRQRRQRVQAQSDRHPRARRFHLRSIAQPGGLRRCAARRRCGSRSGSSDCGQRAYGARSQSGNSSGDQQDRFAERRTGTGQNRDRGRHRPGCFPRRCARAPKKASVRRRSSRGSCITFRRRKETLRRAVASFDYRLLV